MEKYIIRKETKNDYDEVERVVRKSFWNVYRSGCLEHYLLHILRKSDIFLPSLDFVIEINGKIIGQIVFAKAKIKENNKEQEVLTMGPFCILPEYQKQGYGKTLLDYALKEAQKLSFPAVLIGGNIDFYKSCGFKYAKEYNILYNGLKETDDASFFLCRLLKQNHFTNDLKTFYLPEEYLVDEEKAIEYDKKFIC